MLSTLHTFRGTVVPVLGLGLRRISVSHCLWKGNARRPRVAVSGVGSVSEKSRARQDSAREVLAAANRNRWEQSNAKRIELIGKKPSTNVYLASNFEQTGLPFMDALFALREAAQPDMFDCMENPLRAKFVLNMQTKKKTKFVQKLETHVVLPHQLNFLPKSRVLALCRDTDDPKVALELGAIDAGGTDLFSRIEHGTFHWEEYDIVVAHIDWASTVNKLRHVLKDRLPTSKNGRIGENISALVSTFVNGVGLESTRIEGVPEINNLDVIVGQLCWDENALLNNLQCYFDTIETQKSSRIVGDVIISVSFSCPPTGEQFQLDLTPFFERHKLIHKTKDVTDTQSEEQEENIANA